MRIIFAIMLVFSSATHAQTVTQKGVTSQAITNLIQQMSITVRDGKISGLSPEQQASMQRALVIGKLYGCMGETVARPQLDDFMADMQVVGRNIEAHCKQGQAEEARTLALATLKERRDDPVAVAGRRCYHQHKPDITPLLDTEATVDAVKYERWADDPVLAEREVTARDICKGSPQVVAAPTTPIASQDIP